MHFAIAVRQDLMLRVVHREFAQERPGRWRDRFRGCHDFGGKLPPGTFGCGQGGVLAGGDAQRVGFRHADVNAEFSCLSQMKQLAPAAACDDQVAHIDSADRNGARERGDDALERDQLLQPPHIRAAGLYVGGCRLARRRFLGGFLLGHRCRLQQLFPALIGGLGKVEVGLGQCERAAAAGDEDGVVQRHRSGAACCLLRER